jgi:hypothetical protein
MSRLSGSAAEASAANVARTKRLLQWSWFASMIAYTPVAILAAHPQWQTEMQLSKQPILCLISSFTTCLIWIL